MHALKVCHNRKQKNRNGREEKRRFHKTLLGLRAPNYQESIYTGPPAGKTGFALAGVSHHDQPDLIPAKHAVFPGQAKVESPPLSIKPAAEPR